ncbi:membrane-associated progesterone receptor component 1 [Pieris rapae]|uniref:membrane-associated progesterone receptor component 1 n=1 Tax=Pieris rapae TaxID=64459 RepID=UPI000B925646|nr:membrane-associated progesterone receptor component 1 [Pieris rapae]XP_022126982.1 membrane-associated progesterone receptor component 1 [Pieris rapae]
MSSSPEIKTTDNEDPEAPLNFFSQLLRPVNVLLTVIIVVLVYKILKSKFSKASVNPPRPELPKIRKDMTVAELRQYDGNQPDGRVLVAVNGWIFDVTRGRRFYGPGGPYAAFGGKDATRGLATFSVTSSDKEYDDLSDLNSMEMDSIKEWEAQFRENYDLVGKLLKPGEEPTNYSDEDTEETEPVNNPEDKKAQ